MPDVYLEIGAEKTFAGALDWPGWSRAGSDEATALEALLECGPRYARVVRSARLGFAPPSRVGELRVVERLKGNATTDFGAPGVIPSADRAPVDKAECARLDQLLRAAWRALDQAAHLAAGKPLRKGPRGGGRELDAIIRHVVEADVAYLGGVGWKAPATAKAGDRVAKIREAIIEALGASARGEIAPIGPRGGVRWPARYFVRRVAWHAIAHAWEIERRAGADGKRA